MERVAQTASVGALCCVLDLAVFLATHGPDSVSLDPLHRLAKQHVVLSQHSLLRAPAQRLLTSLSEASERRERLRAVDEQRCPSDALSWHTFTVDESVERVLVGVSLVAYAVVRPKN